MTWATLAAIVLVSLTAGYVLGAVHAYQCAIRAWSRHERAHGRGWPPLPRPLPPPPAPPPTP